MNRVWLQLEVSVEMEDPCEREPGSLQGGPSEAPCVYRGYRKGSTEDKGRSVARQLPLSHSVQKETVVDDDGSEWSFVTHYESVG